MKTFRHLVVGLQDSGKTTFAAALWYLLDSGEVPTKLTKGRHQGEFAYLEKIAKLWGDGWRVGHTSLEEEEEIRINLHDGNSDIDTSLEFTDLSGESFERLFATRHCSPSFLELVSAAEGFLLFVTARRKVDDHTILDFLGGSAEVVQSADVTTEPKFDPAKVPQQVQMVDLLQAFIAAPFPRKVPRVAVLVSAWDLARYETPEQWLSNSMPLLDQFLRSNPKTFEFRIYGVSAQGGEVPQQKDGPDTMRHEREALLRLSKASSRIKVVGHGAGPHDLTAPLSWLNRAEEA